ncbi:MAG: NAD(+) synthase [Acholeplasmataceae bacterium]|nr:NAD(+) synthase [Acholeplasmataceae bacterium]
MKNGFLKALTVTPKLTVGNVGENLKEINKVLKETNAELVLFPELSLTGYTCGDLFYQDSLLKDSLNALKSLLELNFNGVVIIGMPLKVKGSLFNVAVVFQRNEILGVIPKFYLKNQGDFNEDRWFMSGLGVNFDEITLFGKRVPFGQIIFEDLDNEVYFGVEICNDMWGIISPGNILSIEGANLIVNLSTSNEFVGKEETRRNTVVEHSRKNCGAYLYTSSGSGESTSETVFGGHNIHASLGKIIREEKFMSNKTGLLYADIDFGHINYQRRKENPIKDFMYQFKFNIKRVKVSFSNDSFSFSYPIDKYPFKADFEEVRKIQISALYKRLEHLNFPKVVMGISGGLDSTLALLVCYDTFKKFNLDIKNICAISMPGLATSNRTRSNAEKLSKSLDVTFKEIDIKEECNVHFESIKQDKNNYDITYENTQARIRTMTLMNLANKEGGIVLGTGNLSEIALGFMTYNADMMSMYAINLGLPKTLVIKQIESYISLFKKEKEILKDILDTPISPELVENQETEKILGSYMINDFLIYRHLVCGDDKDKLAFMIKSAFELGDKESVEMVNRFIKRFYNSQFKRQVMPDGPKILELSLSSRNGYRLASDVKV